MISTMNTLRQGLAVGLLAGTSLMACAGGSETPAPSAGISAEQIAGNPNFLTIGPGGAVKGPPETDETIRQQLTDALPWAQGDDVRVGGSPIRIGAHVEVASSEDLHDDRGCDEVPVVLNGVDPSTVRVGILALGGNQRQEVELVWALEGDQPSGVVEVCVRDHNGPSDGVVLLTTTAQPG
jgi:hypothetical protein